MSSGVNMLTNSLEILDTTKTEFFKLISFQDAQKIAQKYCRFMQCFGPFHMLAVRECSDTRLYRHLRNPAGCSL